MTKSKQIRAILKTNPDMPAAEIAKKVGTNIHYVYTVGYLARKKTKKAKPVSTAPKDNAQAKISSLTKEIEELTVIIAYLERRVKVAEAKRGATV